jgi:hypothetical protein
MPPEPVRRINPYLQLTQTPAVPITFVCCKAEMYCPNINFTIDIILKDEKREGVASWTINKVKRSKLIRPIMLLPKTRNKALLSDKSSVTLQICRRARRFVFNNPDHGGQK